jgi:hypothetical protein
MKKISAVLMALALAVSTFSIADAGNRNGMGRGCGNCPQVGASSEQFRKFQADTIDLRQEMMAKRFEIQRENLKGTPDKAKIASLQAEISAVQSKIQAVRSQSGLPVGKCDGEYGKKQGKHGRGMGFCNNGPCAQK